MNTQAKDIMTQRGYNLDEEIQMSLESDREIRSDIIALYKTTRILNNKLDDINEDLLDEEEEIFDIGNELDKVNKSFKIWKFTALASLIVSVISLILFFRFRK